MANDRLKQRVLERLGNAGVPATVLAEVEEVFGAEKPPRVLGRLGKGKRSRKTAATRTRRVTKRSRKKK